MNVRGLVLAVAVSLTIGLPLGAQQQFWVKPAGAGRGGRSADDALGSLAAVRDAVRASGLAASSDVLVNVMPGRYELDAPLTFSAADSGSAGHTITYRASDPAQPVVLTGGQVVSGWRQTTVNGQRAWRVALPADRWPDGFRDLYADGQRRPRAHGPAVAPAGILRDKQGQPLGIVLDDPSVAKYARPADLQVRQQVSWRHYVLSATAAEPSADGRTNLSLKDTPEWLSPNFVGFKGCAPVVLENALELADEPGEWYFDRASGELTYLPLPGEEAGRTRIVVPRLERLMAINGAQNLRFEGLTFAEAGWHSPNREGWFGYDPGHIIKGQGRAGGLSMSAVYATEARGLSFERCTFTRTGGVGLHLHLVDDATVSGCYFADTSAEGLGLGAVTDPTHAPSDLRVTNNLFYRTNQDYRMGPALLTGKLNRAQIHHNQVLDVPYIGILVNKLFGKAPAEYGQVSVRYNRIEDVMGPTWDGGAFYTWMDGSSDGTPSVVSDNYIKGVHSRDSQGIYLDNDCRYWTVERNVIEQTMGWWYLIKGSHHTLRENYTDNERSRRSDLHTPAEIVEERTELDEKADWQGWPTAAATVANAGLEPAYRDLLTRLPRRDGANQRPRVQMAAKLTTRLLDPLRLHATVSDDGLPHDVLHYAWTKVSGPGEVTFYGQQTRSLDPLVAFAVPGEYVLRLTATDLAERGRAETVVTVTPADLGVDLTAGLPPTACSASAVNSPLEAAANVLDGKPQTQWYPGFPGVGWVQVDLGQPCRLTRVELTLRNDSGDHALSRTEFEILASNDADFATFATLGQQGLDADPQTGGRWCVNVAAQAPAYRYVRWWKRFGFDGVVNELRVWGQR